MNEKQIYTAIRSTLLNGFQALAFPDVSVLRAYQPTLQGRDNGMTIYMSKILDKRVGHPSRKDTYQAETDDFLHTETVFYESTFQIMALVEEKPDDITGLTAQDLINYASHILQSDAGMEMLKQAGLLPLRITDIRNPYFQNDKGQFEASPSFDIILTHAQTVTSVIPAVQAIMQIKPS